MRVTRLIQLVVLRHLLSSAGRSALTILGIVLGVAVVFAIELVNASVIDALRSGMTGATDQAQLSVEAASGVEDDVLERIRDVSGVTAAVPVIESSVRDTRTRARLTMLAVDLLSVSQDQGLIAPGTLRLDDELALVNDPYGVLITREYARRAGLQAGDKLRLETTQGTKDFSVHGTFQPRAAASVYAGDLIVMDVFCAQVAFDRGRRFDRIDIVAQSDAELPQLSRRLSKMLGDGVRIENAARRTDEVERLLGGFQLGLTLASTIALFVGAFIVYHSLAISVARKRREIGTLRALGTTRGQILGLVVGEGVLLGVVGTGVGLAFGWLLARLTMQLVAATVSALYVPVAAMRGENNVEDVAFSSTRSLFIGSAASLLLAALCAWAGHVLQQSALTFVVAALVCCSSTFLAPAFARCVGSTVQRRFKPLGPAVTLGALTFSRNAGRNAVAIAALGMALASVVNIDALIDSMKSSTDAWLGRSFRADLFVFAGSEVRAKFEHPLRESLREELAALPNVEFVQAFRMARQALGGEPFYLMSEDFEGYRRYNELAVVEGDFTHAMSALDAGTGIAASEAFVSKFRLGMGDDVTLQTPGGPRTFRIVLVYTDYRADTGILFTTRDTYKRIWRDSLVDLFSLYLRQGEPPGPVRAQISARWGEHEGLHAFANAEYRSELVQLIDRSMALARATEFVAVFVAILGIVNTLLVSVFDRRREIGMLKAIGAAGAQLTLMVLTESMLIAATSALLGVLLGAGLSAYMVIEALRLQVGWKIAFQLSSWVLVEAFVVALSVAGVAAWLPMRWAAKLEVVTALHCD